jgi:hypothetical protein
MWYQRKGETRSAVERIAAFAAAAQPEHLTPDIRCLFKRNIRNCPGSVIGSAYPEL